MNSNSSNLDPDPEFWLNLDPDPKLCCQQNKSENISKRKKCLHKKISITVIDKKIMDLEFF